MLSDDQHTEFFYSGEDKAEVLKICRSCGKERYTDDEKARSALLTKTQDVYAVQGWQLVPSVLIAS